MKLLKTICIVVLLTATAVPSLASHAMGADLTYKCIGGNQYEVTLKFYRDCGGSLPYCNSMTNVCWGGTCRLECNGLWTLPLVNLKSSSCGYSGSLELYKTMGPTGLQSGEEVTPVCPSTQSTCSNTNSKYPGAEEWIYKGTITLPYTCNDWIFSISIQTRNTAITTANGLGDLYIESFLDNKNGACNSSPEFNNKPVPWICLNQPYCFNHGAIDADGDSLIYTLVDPLNGPSDPVKFNPGYSSASPLVSSPPVLLNRTTGSVCLTPGALEVAVMAVKVDEYRNGIRIGSVTRDMQFVVVPCTNSLPSLTGINGSNNFSLISCVDKPVCFNVFSSDPDTGQAVTVSWNNGIQGAVFSVASGTNPQTGTFCWTPDSADAGKIHVFTVTVRDDACPLNGIKTYTFSIQVSATLCPTVAVTAPPVCLGQCVSIKAVISGGTPPFTCTWNNGLPSGTGPFAVCPVISTTYTATVVDANNNVVTSSSQVQVNPLPAVDFSSTKGCQNEPVIFTDNTFYSGGFAGRWWDFGNNFSSSLQNPSSVYYTPGYYTVKLIATDGLGCTDSLEKVVTIFPVPVVDFFADTLSGCPPLSVQFKDNSLSPMGGTYLWNFGDSTFSSAVNPLHTYEKNGLYSVSLNHVTIQGCKASIVKTSLINILPKPSAFFTFDPKETDLIHSLINFYDQSSGASEWNWYFGDTDSSDDQNPYHSYNTPGNYSVILIATNQFGCSDTIINRVVIHPDFRIFIPTAITPDGNGVNDFFEVVGEGYSECNLVIFDRWGDVIFFSNDNRTRWNGAVNQTSRKTEEDVFVYLITLKDMLGKSYRYTGSITVIR